MRYLKQEEVTHLEWTCAFCEIDGSRAVHAEQVAEALTHEDIEVIATWHICRSCNLNILRDYISKAHTYPSAIDPLPLEQRGAK